MVLELKILNLIYDDFTFIQRINTPEITTMFVKKTSSALNIELCKTYFRGHYFVHASNSVKT